MCRPNKLLQQTPAASWFFVLQRRFSGRLRVRPNRLLLRRQGEGWRDELMNLLDAMAELYESAAVGVGNG